jgi:UDP-N-acetyl-D-mannosaminuronate dehydrogenase
MVAGQGFVGLPLAVHAAGACHEVVGCDVDVARVERLRNSRSFVVNLAPERRRAVTISGRYCATDRDEGCADLDVAAICVPTPNRNREPDRSKARGWAKALRRHLRPRGCVILESSAVPSTPGDEFVPELEAASGLQAGADVAGGYDPGPGVGGHCLFTSTAYVSWWLRREEVPALTLLGRTQAINAARPAHVVGRLGRLLAAHGLALVGARVLLLGLPYGPGLAYNPGQADYRDAPAPHVLDGRVERGCVVSCVEPDHHVVPFERLASRRVSLDRAALEAAESVVLLVEHEELDLPLVQRHGPSMLDMVGRLAGDRVEAL